MLSQPAGIAIDDEGTIFISQMSSGLCILNSQYQLIHSLQHAAIGIAIDKKRFDLYLQQLQLQCLQILTLLWIRICS